MIQKQDINMVIHLVLVWICGLLDLMCLVYLPSIEGIREGTLVSALITGSIARWFIHRISCPDEQGKLVLCLFHKKRKS